MEFEYFTLTKIGDKTYRTSDAYNLTAWLRSHGFTSLDKQHKLQAARLVRGGSICTIFRTGGVAVAGALPDSLVTLLDERAGGRAAVQR